MKRSLILLVTLLTFQISLVSFVHATICPSYEQTRPCWCFDGLLPEDPRQMIQCDGGTTEETIENFFKLLGELNNFSAENPLEVRQFSLLHSSVTTLNLTALANINFEFVDIQYNHDMKNIVGSENHRFGAGLVLLQQSGITDATLARLLKSLRPESVNSIVILGSEVYGSATLGSTGEFVEGLSKFKNLEQFRIEQSGQVASLSGGQFKGNRRLSGLSMLMVGLVEVGKDAFLTEESAPELKDVQLQIVLQFNNITEKTFHNEHGLLSSGRPLRIYLDGNQFETLPQNTFEPLLQADKRHFLVLDWNKFICDDRMQWLRDGKERYQIQVQGVKCTNDPGHDIFTTTLLP